MQLQYSTRATTDIEKKTSKISGKASLASILNLIRVRQWVKNLFLFIPLFFAGNIFDLNRLQVVLAGAVAFCLVASGIYIINDFQDRNIDRLHPKKKLRPIASGEISGVMAWILAVLFSISGLFIASQLHMSFFYILSVYFVINLGYCCGLKNIPIVDLFIVSSGFLLRV